MSFELIYTSAPKGLRPNSSGFCTVAATGGISKVVSMKLEGLSAYEFRFNLSDANATLNPPNFAHTVAKVGARPQSVLSRIGFCGADYSGRANKIAHHFLLSDSERTEIGPADTMLQMSRSVFRDQWQDKPGNLQARALAQFVSGSPSVGSRADTWQQVTGDAGWAGMLAKACQDSTRVPAYVMYSPEAGVDMLRLFAEALALLPAARRWEVSFATYYTSMPAGCFYNWRGVLAGTPAAREVARFPNATIIDLTQPLGQAPDNEFTAAARSGQAVSAPEKGPERVVLAAGETEDEGMDDILRGALMERATAKRDLRRKFPTKPVPAQPVPDPAAPVVTPTHSRRNSRLKMLAVAFATLAALLLITNAATLWMLLAKLPTGTVQDRYAEKPREKAEEKKAAEEAEKKKASEESEKKKAAEEAEKKKAAEEAEKKKTAEEAEKKKAAEEAEKKTAEEAEKKKAAEEAEKKKAAEEAEKKKAAPQLASISLEKRPPKIGKVERAKRTKVSDSEFRFAIGKASVLFRPPPGSTSGLPELRLKGNRAEIRVSGISPTATAVIEQKGGENELVLRLAEGKESDWDKVKAFVFEVTNSKEGGPTYWCRVQEPIVKSLKFGFETTAGSRGEVVPCEEVTFAYPWQKNLRVQCSETGADWAGAPTSLLEDEAKSQHIRRIAVVPPFRAEVVKKGLIGEVILRGEVLVKTTPGKGVLGVSLGFSDLEKCRYNATSKVQWQQREDRKRAVADIDKKLKKNNETADKAKREADKNMKPRDAKEEKGKIQRKLNGAQTKLNEDKTEEVRHINGINAHIMDRVKEVQYVRSAYPRAGVNICDVWGYPVVKLQFRFVPSGESWQKIHVEWIERLWSPCRK